MVLQIVIWFTTSVIIATVDTIDSIHSCLSMHSQANVMQPQWLRVANAFRQRNTICSNSGKMATNSIRNKSLVERNKILFSLETFTNPVFGISLLRILLKATVGAWNCFSAIPLKCDNFHFRNFKFIDEWKVETGDRQQRSIHLTQIE